MVGHDGGRDGGRDGAQSLDGRRKAQENGWEAATRFECTQECVMLAHTLPLHSLPRIDLRYQILHRQVLILLVPTLRDPVLRVSAHFPR